MKGIAKKTVAVKREANVRHMNPALERITKKRLQEQQEQAKKSAGLDVRDIQRQVDEMLKADKTS